MDIVKLRNEITTDPLGRGYSGMSDAAVAADLNTVYRTSMLDALDGATIYEQVDIAEFLSLTSAQQAEVWNIAHLGASIRVGAGSKARARFLSLFGGGSTTISNLLAAITQSISRAQELGLGTVYPGHVYRARAGGGD